jgi:PAS domain-containing protein
MIEAMLPPGFTQQQIDQAHDIALLVLEDTHFVSCNQAAANLLGYDCVDELLKTHPFMLSPEYQADGELSATKANYMMDIARISGQHCFDWQHKAKNNDVINIKVTLHHSNWHNGKKCILVHWKLIEEVTQSD